MNSFSQNLVSLTSFHSKDDLTLENGILPPVILGLHGWGTDEHDLVQICQYLSNKKPYATLRAPIRMTDLFKGYYPEPTGYSWFTRMLLEGTDFDQQAYDDAEMILKWCDNNLLPGQKIIPAGFSQGAMLTTQLLRVAPERIAAAVVFSGYHAPGLVDNTHNGDDYLKTAAQNKQGIPVFFGYGDSDTVIAYNKLEETAQWLQSYSDPSIHIYPGMGHEIRYSELEDVAHWIDPLMERWTTVEH